MNNNTQYKQYQQVGQQSKQHTATKVAVKSAGGPAVTTSVPKVGMTLSYIPPPGDSVKNVDLYRKKEGTSSDYRKNAILAGIFGIAAFIHSMLVQSKMY